MQMKLLLCALMLVASSTIVLAQVQGSQLRDTKYVLVVRQGFPPNYHFTLDTLKLKDSLLVRIVSEILMESTDSLFLLLVDSIKAVRLSITDTSASAFWHWDGGGGGTQTAGEMETVSTMTFGDGYSALRRTDNSEPSIADSCTVFLRAYAVARSECDDTTASYRLYATVRRIGNTIQIKDTALTIIHEDNPLWDFRFSLTSSGILRVQGKAGLNDTVKWTATLEVTRACRQPFDTIEHVLPPSAVPGLAMWLDPERRTNFLFESPIRHGGDSNYVRIWYDSGDSARNAVQDSAKQQYKRIYDPSREMWGLAVNPYDGSVGRDSMLIGTFYIHDLFFVIRYDTTTMSPFGHSTQNLFSWSTVAAIRGPYLQSQTDCFTPGSGIASGWRVNDSTSAQNGFRIDVLNPVIVYMQGEGSTQTWTLSPRASFRFWKGMIYEVIAFSRQVTSYERRGIYNYLKRKYHL